MRAPRLHRLEDRSRLVSLSSGRVWVSDVGPLEGPCDPVVLIHGILTSSYEWWQVTDAIAGRKAPGQRCIAVDLPGTGNSDRPSPEVADGYSPRWLAARMVELLDELGIERVMLVAHQFGGAVAAELVDRWPERCSRLVLIAPLCFEAPLPVHLPDALPGWRRFWRYVGVMPLVFRTMFRREDLRQFLRRTISTPELLDSDEVDVHWDRLCRPGGLEAVQAMLDWVDDRNERDTLHERLAALRVPSLIVWGDRDAVLPLEHRDRLASVMAGSATAIIDGCGHAPQRERPLALVDAIERWRADGRAGALNDVAH